jgi:hypothetical protein
MVVLAQDQKRSEAEKEWKGADALYHERRAVVRNHADARRKAKMREGTDKVAAVTREQQAAREKVDKWRDQAHKQIEQEFAAKIAGITADKHRACLAIEEEIARVTRAIEDEERKAIALLEVEREVAVQRYLGVIDSLKVPGVPVESE